MTPQIFISHSHQDENWAKKIATLFDDYKLKYFLDQEKIVATQNLPDRIRKGIEWCSVFLLIWSRNARNSIWVNREWESALRSGKRILPYKLDESPLPTSLDDLVWVDSEDYERGSHELLRGVYYPNKVPDIGNRLDITPGKWKLSASSMGIQANFIVNLRANGKLTGQTDFLGLKVGVEGKWRYDIASQIFFMQTVGRMGYQTQSENIEIRIIRRNGNVFYGKGSALQDCTLTKLN